VLRDTVSAGTHQTITLTQTTHEQSVHPADWAQERALRVVGPRARNLLSLSRLSLTPVLATTPEWSISCLFVAQTLHVIRSIKEWSLPTPHTLMESLFLEVF